MLKNLFTLVIAFPVMFVAGLLTGCGGGGGGGGLKIDPAITFVKWSDVTPPAEIDFEGLSSDGSYTAPAPFFTVTNITDAVVSAGAKATITYGSGGSITSVAVETPVTTVIWKESDGHLIDDSGAIVRISNVDGSNVALVSNALDPAVAWEYQTYGVWLTGLGKGTGNYGSATFGVPTAGSAIPLMGTPTFSGSTVGSYVNPAGELFLTSSQVTIDADFLNRSLDFSTFATQTLDPASFAATPAPSLSMMGTLTYAPATNSFSGPVSATGLIGTSTGQFYGPAAEELGGVFSLTGAGVETYSGAYGAKR